MTKQSKIERWKWLEKWQWKGMLNPSEEQEFFRLCRELGAKKVKENFGGWELPPRQ